MRRYRLVPLAALAVAGTLLAVPASAATKRLPCGAVRDAAGDAGWVNNAGGETLAVPSLDVTSADVASNGKVLTAVIRVKKLAEQEPNSPGGKGWIISMSAGTASLGLEAYQSPFGERFSSGKGTFDYAKNEIRIHVALADVAFLKIKKGTVLRNLTVSTTTFVGFPRDLDAVNAGPGYAPPGGNADTAENPKAAYKVGALNCVKVGK